MEMTHIMINESVSFIICDEYIIKKCVDTEGYHFSTILADVAGYIFDIIVKDFHIEYKRYGNTTYEIICLKTF
jgi:hypothetical protein